MDNIISYIDSQFPVLNLEKECLYVVSTPIGNIKDISYRALFVLNNVSAVFCEDTRVTVKILNHYGIKNKLISLNARTENKKIQQVVTLIKSGNSIALVSDSGTPGISDPGLKLIGICINSGIRIIPVPGSSALIQALVMSGFNSKSFFFQGFLPQKGRQSVYNNLKNYKASIVIFESKFKFRKTLQELYDNFGNRDICVCREMTKKFESYYRGRLKDIIIRVDRIPDKGEFVIVVNNFN